MNEVLIGIAATATVMWISWISWTTIQNKERIGELRTNSTSHGKDVEEIKESFKAMGERVESSNNKIGDRLDLFLKTEIQELKGLVDDVTNSLKQRK